VVAGIVLLNAFFVLGEYALIASQRTVLAVLAGEGSHRARSALRLKEAPARFIGTSQVGVTIASIVLGAIGERLFAGFFDPWIAAGIAFAIGLLLLTYLHVVIGELTPKALALAQPERVALWCALPLEAVFISLRPLVFLLKGSTTLLTGLLGVKTSLSPRRITEEELRLLLGDAGKGGVIEEAEGEMALAVLDFGDKEVGDLMVARPDVHAVSESMTLRKAIDHIAQAHRTLYPVIGDKGEITGVLDVRDLIAAATGRDLEKSFVSELTQPVHMVPETKSALELLAEFKIDGLPIAVVADEYGQMAGIVTLTDLLEEIIGEHFDDDLLARRPKPLGAGRISLPGQLSIEEFNEQYEAALPDEDYRTIGGFVFGELGRSPEENDVVLYESIRFTVTEINGARIERLTVKL
jgi:CBS domain containing-hemolysin-like protein